MGHFIWDWVWLGGKLTSSAFLRVHQKKKMGMRYWVAFFYGVLFYFRFSFGYTYHFLCFNK